MAIYEQETLVYGELLQGSMNGLNLYGGLCPGYPLDYNTAPTQRVNDHSMGKIEVLQDGNNNKRKIFVFNLFLLDIFDLIFQFCVLSF